MSSGPGKLTARAANRKSNGQAQQNIQQSAFGGPKTPVLNAYQWDKTKNEYKEIRLVESDRQLMPEPAPQGEETTAAWNNIDRVVLRNLEVTVRDPKKADMHPPQLVLDLIPESSSIEWQGSREGNSRSSITVNCKMRCVLMNAAVSLKVRIEKVPSSSPRVPSPKARYTSFLFFEDGVAKISDKNHPSGFNAVPDLIAKGQLAGIIQRYNYCQPLQVFRHNVSGKDSRFADCIGLEYNAPPCNDQQHQQVDVYFEPALQGGFHTIAFKAELEDLSTADCRIGLPAGETLFLRAFGETDKNQFNIEIPRNKLRPKAWTVVQHPSSQLRDGPKTKPPFNNRPVGLWVVEVRNIPAAVIPPLWRKMAKPYFESLRTVVGSQPVSFLPDLKDLIQGNSEPSPESRKRWVISYLIEDQATGANPRYSFNTGGDLTVTGGDNVLVSSLALEPLEDCLMTGTLEQLKLHNGKSLEVIFTAGSPPPRGDGNSAAQCKPGVAGSDPDRKAREGRSGIIIWCSQPIVSLNGAQFVRMGAFDLQFAAIPPREKEPDSPSRMEIFPQERLPRVFVDVNFAVSRVNPGGQDDVPGEDYVADCRPQLPSQPQPGREASQDREIARRFRRNRPLVIVWNQTPQETGDDQLLLHVAEGNVPSTNARVGQSQKIELTLLNRAKGDQGSAATRDHVIVLDGNPFMVALVEFLRFYRQSQFPSAAIANWRNFGLEGSNWEILSRAEAFDLVLPPQAVGEEMEKSKRYNGDDNSLGGKRFFDFRLSPPAKLKLLPSFFAQNFTEPPWNLRRVLGYVRQRAPGAEIKRLQFELLYGLACDAETPFLRLAEIFAMTGAIPGPLQWNGSGQQSEVYRQARAEWSKIYGQYLNRVGILEPWDAHQPESLLLSENVTCRIRFPAESVSQIDRSAAELENPVEPENKGALKGGVTWGVESKNIYTALRAREESRNVNNAQVSDLYFSSLGGWGRLKASFNNNNSVIYADVAMGRTYFYKLERIGCIGCFRNKAKHVIVYERTVARARQFKDSQNELKGRPALRKVREYVEILQEQRTYPDVLSKNTRLRPEEMDRQRGFVAYCAFEKGAQIKVDSAWGSDVGDYGWKVPLWNPVADAAVYPKPHVALGVYSNVEGRSVPLPCEIADPQKLFFYTETKNRKTNGLPDSDPDNWELVPDLDYVDMPLPVPVADFENGRMEQTTPGDDPAPAGHGPVTFTLEPSTAPADIIAARGAQPLAAALKTVTVSRASLKLLKEAKPGQMQTKLLGFREQVVRSVQLLLPALPQDPQAAVREVRNRIENGFNNEQSDFRKYLNEFESVKTHLQTLAGDGPGSLTDLVTKREVELYDSLRARLEKFVTDSIERYRKWAEEVRDKGGNFADGYERAIAGLFNDLRIGLLLLPLSPGLLPNLAAKYSAAIARIEAQCKKVTEEINKFIDGLPDQIIKGDNLAELKRRVEQAFAEADRLLDQVKKIGDTRPEMRIPEPGIFIDGILGLYRDKAKEIRAQLLAQSEITKEAAKLQTEKFQSWIKDADAEIAKLRGRIESELRAKESELRTQLQQLINSGATEAQINAVKAQIKVVEDKIAEVRARAETELSEVIRKLVDVRGNAEQLLDNLEQKLRDEIIRKPGQTAQATFNELRAKIRERFERIDNPPADNLFKLLDDANERLKAQTAALLKQIFSEEPKKLLAKINDEIGANGEKLRDKLLSKLNQAESLRNELEKVRDQALQEVQRFADNTARLLPKLPPAEAFADVADKGFRLVRAFGQPPEVPNLEFRRPEVAYFYKELEKRVDLTPVLSLVNQAKGVGQAGEDMAKALKPLGVELPTLGTLEQLIPRELAEFNLSELFPDFAGAEVS